MQSKNAQWHDISIGVALSKHSEILKKHPDYASLSELLANWKSLYALFLFGTLLYTI